MSHGDVQGWTGTAGISYQYGPPGQIHLLHSHIFGWTYFTLSLKLASCIHVTVLICFC